MDENYTIVRIPDKVIQEYTGYRFTTCGDNDEKLKRFHSKSFSERALECFWHGFYETKFHAEKIVEKKKKELCGYENID